MEEFGGEAHVTGIDTHRRKPKSIGFGTPLFDVFGGSHGVEEGVIDVGGDVNFGSSFHDIVGRGAIAQRDAIRSSGVDRALKCRIALFYRETSH